MDVLICINIAHVHEFTNMFCMQVTSGHQTSVFIWIQPYLSYLNNSHIA